MSISNSQQNAEQDRELVDFPQTRVSSALMLAQQIIDMFDQVGATSTERRTALDLARRIGMDEQFVYLRR